MKYLKFLLFFVIVISGNLNASFRVSIQNTDEEYKKLANQYPSVGMVYCPESISKEFGLEVSSISPNGSGVLVFSSEFPKHLENRIVLTAAHVLFNEETNQPFNNIYFGGNVNERIRAKVYVHEKYKEIPMYSPDLALLILEEPSKILTPVSINWSIDKEKLLGQKVTHCGYGDVESLYHEYSFMDINKRACHSLCLLSR